MRKAEGAATSVVGLKTGWQREEKKSRRPREDEISSSGWVVEARTVLVATTEISVFVDDGSIVSAPFFPLLHFQGRSSKRTIVDSLAWSGLLLVFFLSLILTLSLSLASLTLFSCSDS